ncbi:antibiotic biosynthesis monooxygenase family protein [Paenibacillus sp. GCM10027629]|uniref:antibiotic biosynthesis monooxygenase family protein n=1 Tax=Paenibacillus sp. GCM10027629 TaxID=3273414 RepID=UPI00362A1A44
MNYNEHTPNESHYAVIFTSQRTPGDNGYHDMAKQMDRLASVQPGFLGADSVRDASGAGITISYWDSLEAIRNWKREESHLVAQQRGKKEWYEHYEVKICKVERAYSSRGRSN